MGDGIRIAILGLLLLLGCSDDPNPGPGKLATRCDQDEDCESLICAGLADEPKLCTVACTDPIGDECDDGFRCRRPEDSDRLACVCTSPLGCEDEQPNEQCTQTSDCDDDIDCTADLCDDGRCLHRLAPQLCAAGESCRPLEGGCKLGDACMETSNCQADVDACTGSVRCDVLTNRCLYSALDNDGDGFLPRSCGGDDCDDANPNSSPAEVERCDASDNDCDGDIDEASADDDCDGLQCTNGSCSGGGCGALTDCDPSDGLLCVDLDNDSSSCGSCGFSCSGGLACFDGVCSERNRCEDGVDCPANSSCVNVPGAFECRCDSGFEPNTVSSACIDIDECSRGFDDCGSTSFCLNTNGSFLCTCESGFRLSGGECLDVNECAEGFDCGTGTCINLSGTVDCSCDFGSAIDPVSGICRIVDECQAGTLPGHRWCDGACRNVLNDLSYCGGCNNACTGAGLCLDGACACSDASLLYCDGVCLNAHVSTTDCGFCGNACAVGASCVEDECRCPDGQDDCGGTCVAFGTFNHCLGCDDACPVGATCTGSGCACPPGLPNECNGRCVNIATDGENCGGCGGFCDVGIGMACMGGECRCPPQAPDECNGACKNFQTDEDACGDCDTQCSGMCVNGECNNEG